MLKTTYEKNMNSNLFQKSNYNYFVKREEGLVGYNARTGVLALLSEETGRILQEDKDKAITASDIGETNLCELTNMGFLHNGNEVEQILSKFNKVKDKKETLNFTILPTMLCNFSCDYCFQGGHEDGKSMSLETQQSTLIFIRSAMAAYKKITCTWFGGEPLIAKKTVLDMSHQIKSMADERGLEIYIDIVTNAILLTPKTAKELANAGVKQAQVSFDALIFKNSKKRGVLDVAGHPSLILKNLIEARKYLDIRIRVNVSTENSNDVSKIVEVLSQNGFKDNYYIARIHNHQNEFQVGIDSPKQTENTCGATGCNSCSSTSSEVPACATLSRSDYARFEHNFFLNHPEALQRVVQKLVPKSHFCSATLGSMFVIDPEGYVSRCWHSAGSPAESIGNVHDLAEAAISSKVSRDWDEFSPLAYPSCRGCKVLPLCMGGCSHPRMFMETTKPPCESIKYQVQFCVDTLGRIIATTPEQ
ncbi:MAG: SPASM domain-containing protein [Kastovskya adunca ATA6-11-RM4]|jgi:uncharacterized protein|nr:SPASM domain-containing protein [Kastovskya adunca ATA6-11-RM4]